MLFWDRAQPVSQVSKEWCTHIQHDTACTTKHLQLHDARAKNTTKKPNFMVVDTVTLSPFHDQYTVRNNMDYVVRPA